MIVVGKILMPCPSTYFELVQIFCARANIDYVTYCARPIHDSLMSKFSFCASTNYFVAALRAIQFLVSPQKF